MSLVQCPTPGSSDAGHLLDGMSDSVPAGEEDRIGTLPDDILLHALSFLPSRDSVCTCVLARRWRNLWKSVPTVVAYEAEDPWFVTSLLLLRDRAPLHEFVFSSFFDGEPQHIETWLRYAASCHVRVLRLGVHRYDLTYRLPLPNMTLVCQQLTTLGLCGVRLEEHTLDFSCCPALDVLELQYCEINAEKISSQSLTHLSMEICSFDLGVRTCISCPSLAALDLDGNVGLTPSLETMPSLVTAYVRFDAEWFEHEGPYDHCLNGGYYGDCGDELCPACQHIDNEGDVCVLLDGLRGATDLKLISTPQMIICTRDFKWHHIFSKLKTLYLNKWCLAANFSGLVYFLRYSPILEKLTISLQICEKESFNIEDDSYNPSKQFVISKNLKVVEIKCYDKYSWQKVCYDKVESIHRIVEILVSLGVPPELISKQHNHQ